MKHTFYTFVLMISLFLAGCSPVEDKTLNITTVYALTSIVSLVLLCCYIMTIKKKDKWFLLLYTSVFIVNVGYLLLSISKTIEFAYLANRVSYFGSVFLPLSMFFSILNISKIRYHKYLPLLLITISLIVFIIAASPGYLPIYYKDITLVFVNGSTILEKSYGPLHIIYLYYLIGYFMMMFAAIFYASKKKLTQSTMHSVVILIAVGVNIAVWLIEQLVDINFEFLSVSYIISELFLLGLYLAMQEMDIIHHKHINKTKETPVKQETTFSDEQVQLFTEGLSKLTPTEHTIYTHYTEGKSIKEVLALLNIKENTLKYHNKNIYSKLSVSSRKQLIDLYKYTKREF